MAKIEPPFYTSAHFLSGDHRIPPENGQVSGAETGGRDLVDVLQLEDQKQLLKQYYAGQQMESPNGGFLIPLGIRADPSGSATGIFECSVSSLRYELTIPKATRSERKKVKEALDAGGDAGCPRHGPNARLARAGKDLVCRSCGVAYAKV